MEVTRRVAIVGVGQSKREYSYNKKIGWKQMIVEAAYEALKDANMEAKEIDGGIMNYHGENWMGYGGIGPTASEELGMLPVGFIPIVAQCTGGGLSAMTGWTQVASGLHKRVLCIAFDCDDSTFMLDNYNISNDSDWDYMQGLGHVEAGMMRDAAYYRKYNYDLKVSAKWYEQCMWYANRNPRAARFKEAVAPMEAMTEELLPGSRIPSFEAQMATSPIVTMGAAAFILVPAEDASRYTTTPVYLDGVEYGVSPGYFSKLYHYPKPALQDYDITDLPNTRWAAEQAYRMARIKPEEIDIAHCYLGGSTGVALLEAMQICPRGKGGQFVLDGETAIDGRCPTQTDGGNSGYSLTSGSEVGDMIIELAHQLRGDVEYQSRQVKDPEVGVCAGYQAIGSGSTVVVLTNRRK